MWVQGQARRSSSLCGEFLWRNKGTINKVVFYHTLEKMMRFELPSGTTPCYNHRPEGYHPSRPWLGPHHAWCPKPEHSCGTPGGCYWLGWQGSSCACHWRCLEPTPLSHCGPSESEMKSTDVKIMLQAHCTRYQINKIYGQPLISIWVVWVLSPFKFKNFLRILKVADISHSSEIPFFTAYFNRVLIKNRSQIKPGTLTFQNI